MVASFAFIGIRVLAAICVAFGFGVPLRASNAQPIEQKTPSRLIFATGCQSTANNESNGYTQTFQYDLIHNITSKDRTNQIQTGETCQGTLKSAPAENNFAFDYTYSPVHPHRAIHIGELSLKYDDSGNVTQKGDLTFIWDDDNHLAATDGPDSSLNLRNYYDAGGLRVFKESEKFGATLFVSQYFDVRLSETKSASKHFFAGGTRIASEVISFDPENEGSSTGSGRVGEVLFFHQDHLGSTGLLTNGSGSAIEDIEYFADGDVWIHKNNSEPINGYKFTGKFLDPETGLYDFGARFYDPKTSLWLGVDPLPADSPGSMAGKPMVASLYGYANQNPLRFIDPDGRNGKNAPKITPKTPKPYPTLPWQCPVNEPPKTPQPYNPPIVVSQPISPAKPVLPSSGVSLFITSAILSSGPAFALPDINGMIGKRTEVVPSPWREPIPQQDKIDKKKDENHPGKNIALGLGDLLFDFAFSKGVPYPNWHKEGLTSKPYVGDPSDPAWTTSEEFKGLFFEASGNAKQIHFNLSGMFIDPSSGKPKAKKDVTKEDVRQLMIKGKEGFKQGNYTNAELYYIYHSSKFRGKAIFWYDGTVVDPPWEW